MALPDNWHDTFYFGGSPRQLDLNAPNPMGSFNLGNVNPPPLPSQPAAPVAPAAPNPAGGFADSFNGEPTGGGGAPTGPAAPGGPGPISNTAEAFSAFPGLSPIGATQAAQAQNTADISATNNLATQGPIGSFISALAGSPAAGTLSNIAANVAGVGLPSPASLAFAVPSLAMNIGTALGAPTAAVGNRSLANDQNDLNAAFPTINPFEPQAPDSNVSPSGNAFDSPTGTPGTSGVNSAGQSVGFGAPGTAGAGVAGGFSSAFGGSGAGGATGSPSATDFGGIGNNTIASGIEGEASDSGGGGAPGAPGPAGPGPGGAGEAGDSGGGSSGEGPAGDGEKKGGLIGKRKLGPRMLAAKLKTGGGTVTQGKRANVDSVPVTLAKGEFVLPRGAVTPETIPLLEQLRQGGLQSRAGGMAVGPVRSRR